MPTEIITDAAGQAVQEATGEGAQEAVNQTAEQAAAPAVQAAAQAGASNPMWWNTWYFVLGFALIIIAMLALVYLILKMDHERRMSKPKESRNIIVLILVAGFALIALLLLAEFIGVLPRGWMKDNGRWLIPLIIVSMLGFAMYFMHKGKIKTVEEAKERAIQIAEDFYEARELTGREQGYTVKYFRSGFEKDGESNNIPVGTFFVWIRNYTKAMLVVQLNMRDLSVCYLHYDPAVEFINKEMKKQIGVSADAYMEAKKKYEEESGINDRPDEDKKDAY